MGKRTEVDVELWVVQWIDQNLNRKVQVFDDVDTAKKFQEHLKGEATRSQRWRL